MATSQNPNPTSSDLQKLAEQQAKFNAELIKTESLLSGIEDSLDKKIIGELKKSISSANKLNVEFGAGVDISKKLANEQLQLSAKIETLQRARNKTRKTSDIESLTYQIKIYEKLQSQLYKTEEVLDEEKKITAEKKKQNSLLDLVKNKMKSALGPVTELFTMGGLFKLLVDGMFKIDNQATQLGKSLGISKDAAMGLRKSMADYSMASKDSFVNTERLFKAQEGLTEQLGIAVDFGNQERETFARLTEITGLSAQEAGKLATFSASTGKSTDDYVSSLRKAAFTAQQTNRIHISDKELLSSVSKLSAGILTKFQGNPAALAAAVVQAKKLGTSLEQMDKVGDSMLNWESSIENELQAELITGKKLNFERARAAALTGDQATLMQEVANQAGSLAEFQDMNVIAQQSLAQAFGMNRDEMADMLMKQEAINKYGDAAGQLNKDQLADMEKRNMSADDYLKMVDNQRSTQEQFNDLITKLQDSLVNIAAGPLGTIMKGFSWILEQAYLIYPIITAIGLIMAGNLVSGVMAFGKGLMAAIAPATTLAAVETESAIAATTAAEATSFGAATLWIVGGLAAVAGAMAGYALSSKKSMKDGVMAPSGKVLYSGAEGAISLGANDTVVAGTNLGGKGGGGNTDLSPMIAAINELHSTMKNKSNDIYMDSQKVGTQVGKQNSTGTEQSKNSYQLA
jgi:hypothetical protein